MRVSERQGLDQDAHFTEGEPDLEPPEELAVLELDDEALLEEDLENQVDLEDEVDEEILESSLDHLVHDGDEDEDDDENDVTTAPGRAPVAVGANGAADVGDLEDLEIEDLEDRVESLDRILREKLAGDEEPEDALEEVGIDAGADIDGITVPSCGPDEFVCRGCFLVRHSAQRAAGAGAICHDCSE